MAAYGHATRLLEKGRAGKHRIGQRHHIVRGQPYAPDMAKVDPIEDLEQRGAGMTSTKRR